VSEVFRVKVRRVLEQKFCECPITNRLNRKSP